MVRFYAGDSAHLDSCGKKHGANSLILKVQIATRVANQRKDLRTEES
jgi:hypothetical protein